MERLYYGGTKAHHEVLTYEEARERGIVPVYWKEAQSAGWILTDDGFVLEAVKVSRYEDRREAPGRRHARALVTTVAGRFWVNAKNVLLWERLRERRLKLSYRPPVHWAVTEGRKTRTRRMVKLYAMMLLAGRVDWHVLSVVWKPEQIVPGWRVRKLLREEEIISMVTKETYALMKAKGVTAEYVIDKMLSAVALAELKKDAGAILRACEDFRSMLGMERSAGRDLPSEIGDGSREARFEDIVERAERELAAGSVPQLPEATR